MTFDIVGVVADSFRLAFRNFFKIAGYMFLAVALPAVMVLVMAGSLDPMAIMMSVSAMGILPILFFYVVIFCANMACQSAISEDATGNPVSFREGLSKGIAASPMAFIVLLALGILIGIVSVIPMLATGGMAMNAGSMNSISALSIIGALLTMVVVFALSCIFAPIASVLVVEREGFGSIKRAMQLTAGHRLRIFLSMLLFGVVLVVAVVIWQIFISILASVVMSGGSAGAMIGGGIFLGLISFCVGILFSSTGMGFQGAIYAQLLEIED